MPYIPEQERAGYDNWFDELPAGAPAGVGHLNYAITKLCLIYLREHGKNYAKFNEIVGVLECAKQELYRRHVSPYEDDAKSRNGDVYA